MYNNIQLTSWQNFLHSLQTRFGSSQFEDPQGAHVLNWHKPLLFGNINTKSTQCPTDLQVPKNFLLSCFISGLKPHICRDVQALQPINLRQAIDLVKLQEDKYSKLWKFNRCSSNNTYLSYHSSTNLTSTSYPPLLPEPQNHIPIKKLSTSQLQEQREKGLCYNCNEKFLPGHKCKGKDFLLVH